MLKRVKSLPEDSDLIESPSHYVEGRGIEPIELIENWGLCHHLACVIKYIARFGRKHDALRDLKKAQWYLMREKKICESLTSKCPQNRSEVLFTSSEVSSDWDLNPNLQKVLKYIEGAIGSLILKERVDYLLLASAYLKKAITLEEESLTINQQEGKKS